MDALNVLTALAGGFVFGGFALHAIPESTHMFHDYLAPLYAPACTIVHHNETHRLLSMEEAEEKICAEASKIPEYPWALLTASLVWLLLVFLDRAFVAHGMGGGDHHSHDHISQAYVSMQTAKEEGGGAGRKAPGDILSSTPPPAAAAAAAESGYGVVASSVDHSPCQHHAVVPVDNAAVHNKTEQAAHRDSILRAWVFFLALSVHSIFDGLAVGVASSMVDFVSITVAVVAHKAFDVSAAPLRVPAAQPRSRAPTHPPPPPLALKRPSLTPPLPPSLPPPILPGHCTGRARVPGQDAPPADLGLPHLLRANDAHWNCNWLGRERGRSGAVHAARACNHPRAHCGLLPFHKRL